MKKISNNILILATICIAIIFTVSLSSCKEEDPTKGVVRVLYQDSVPIEGANVKIWRGNIERTGTSDANGNVEAEFQYEAILDVEAEFPLTVGKVWRPDTDEKLVLTESAIDSLNQLNVVFKGKATLILERNKTKETVVLIKKQNLD